MSRSVRHPLSGSMSVSMAALRQRPPRRRRRQRGVSLITSLLFMVAALVLGVSVMSINVMQERMVGNSRDRELALQAAEAALRDAEQDLLRDPPLASAFRDDCGSGLCTPPSQRAGVGMPSARPAYEVTPGFVWNDPGAARTRIYGSRTGVAAYPGVVAQPRYVIERMGPLAVVAGVDSAALGSPASQGTAYRITARAVGGRPDTVVMLQSIFSVR